MNVVSYLLKRFQGLGFEKREQQDYASVNVEKATLVVNMVHWFVAEVVSVVVYCDIPVSACHVDGFACDSRLNAFVISLAHWKYVVARPHHSPLTRCQISVTVAVCY